MTFIRFHNEPASKHIGFTMAGKKEEIFQKLLWSIINFTMPGSYTNVFYQGKDYCHFVKYERQKGLNGQKYRLNGHCDVSCT